ncbi:MAG: hypothetical protein FJZ96_00885 [Chloroflexi bacterium]|nr:hypothetical protein [Chloroflexota bacterium]
MNSRIAFYSKMLLLFILLVAWMGGGIPSASAQESEWQEIPLPPGLVFFDMVFVDNETGWAVGGTEGQHNLLYNTTDGGQTWTEQDPGVAEAFWIKIIWGDPMIGYILGFGGGAEHLLHTNDGGQSWQPSTPPVSGQFYDLTIQPGGALWGLTTIYEPRSYHTWYSADGEMWTERTIASTAGARVAELTFPTAGTGYAVGKVGTDNPIPLFMKTSDGGGTWLDVPQPLATGALIGEFFFDDLNGFICGESEGFGVILKTNDGGGTWTEVARLSGSELSIADLVMANLNEGYAYGFWQEGDAYGMNIYQTMDGGNTWQKSSLPSASKLIPPIITPDKVYTAFYDMDSESSSLFFKLLTPYTIPEPPSQPGAGEPPDEETPEGSSSLSNCWLCSDCGSSPVPLEYSFGLLTLTFGAVYVIHRKITPPKDE